MIKIEKDLTKVPKSLQVPPVSRSARTTHKKRKKIIENGEYKSNSSNDARYKMADIKRPLFEIYHGKCAFCEQRVEQWQVEHFRPKSLYHWVAFSWDNLLYSCPTCNVSKSNKFEVSRTRATEPPADLTTINSTSADLDKTEKPKFFNPEIKDPEPLLQFQEDGLIKSRNRQLKYTIKTCKVDRPYLNDYRKKIWDDFVKDLESEILDAADRDEARANVMILLRKFRRDAEQRPDNEFLAFRRYAVKHFLADKLRELLS